MSAVQLLWKLPAAGSCVIFNTPPVLIDGGHVMFGQSQRGLASRNRRCCIKRLALLCLLPTCFLMAQDANLGEKRHALRYGALASMTLHVVDSRTNAVQDADVSLNFVFHDDTGTIAFGRSDQDGRFTVQQRCTGPVEYSAEKPGYYRTDGEFDFYKPLEPCVADGRWLPWNPQITVLLKEKRKPTPMFAKSGRVTFPEQDKRIGYDFMLGDFLPPYGRGRYADLVFEYSFVPGKSGHYADFTRQLHITTSGGNDGLMMLDADPLTEMISAYEAPEEGYVKELKLLRVRTPTNIVEEIVFPKDKYIIFRSRTMMDDNGTITNAHYGKIYGPLSYGGSLQNTNGFSADLTSYINPTPNSRNIEFDVSKNLFGWRFRVTRP